MPTPHRRLTDPRELRALAHPVRVAIVEQLSLAGALTATELADRLDETPANCSWHLRKLAEHGFVVEAEGGRGRQRPWRVPGLGFTWDRDPGADDAPPEDWQPAERRQAAAALSQVAMDRALARLFDAAERQADEPPDWRAAQANTENMAWVTAAELAALNADLAAVLDRFAGRLTDPASRPPGSRLCEFVAWGVPTYFPGIEATPQDSRLDDPPS